MATYDPSDDDESDDKTTYHSISNRDPLEQVGGVRDPDPDGETEDQAPAPPSPNFLVAQAIAQNQARQNAPNSTPSDDSDLSGILAANQSRLGASPDSDPDIASIIASNQARLASPENDSYLNDPLMKQYEQDQAKLDQFKQQKNFSDLSSNLAQSFATIARGEQAPEANKLPEAINAQNEGLLKSNEQDLTNRQRILNAIEMRKSRESVSANNLALRQALLQSGNAGKNDRLDAMNIRTAGSLFKDPNINQQVSKLNAAKSLQGLLSSVNNGEIKGSKNIRNQLTNMLVNIEQGSPGGVSDRQKIGIDNFYTALKDADSWLESHPNDSIPPEYLKQLQIEGNALGDRAAKNFVALTNGVMSGSDLSGGNPDVDPGRVFQLAKQRRDSFLSDSGYDSTGSRQGQSASSTQPSSEGPHGPSVIQNGIKYIWNGSKYAASTGN